MNFIELRRIHKTKSTREREREIGLGRVSLNIAVLCTALRRIKKTLVWLDRNLSSETKGQFHKG